MKKLDSISVNIWDDYYDDGYVPNGEIQSTYIYVEDEDMPLEERKECLEFLLNYINDNIKLRGVKMWIELYDSKKEYPNLIGNAEAEKILNFIKPLQKHLFQIQKICRFHTIKMKSETITVLKI